MTLPSHQSDWAFDEPRNVATLTVRQILHGGRPILLVAHAEDDGTWQFLTGGDFSVEDAMLVGLDEIVAHDPTVSEIADLPLGWVAHRERIGGPWRRLRDDEDAA